MEAVEVSGYVEAMQRALLMALVLAAPVAVGALAVRLLWVALRDVVGVRGLGSGGLWVGVVALAVFLFSAPWAAQALAGALGDALALIRRGF